MKTLTLLGEPKSSQHVYKYHCRFGFPSGYLSAEGKNIKESYREQIGEQWTEKPLEGAVGLKVKLFFQRGGKHDIDNFSKLTLDSGNNLIWEDDSQIKELTITKGVDKINPRVELEVYEINN